ncbi:MAG TPA: hypothetical protein VIK59_03540 [Verrucomicrobiae bacterium]
MSDSIHQPWNTIALFEKMSDAQRLEVLLKEKGLAARTYNDRLLQLFLFLCSPRATFRVQVRANDLEHATTLMKEDSAAAALLEKAIHCPACGSLRVSYPQMTRKFFLPTLLLHLGIIFRIIDHEAYCEKCHFIWSLPKDGIFPIPKIHAAKTFPFNDSMK